MNRDGGILDSCYGAYLVWAAKSKQQGAPVAPGEMTGREHVLLVVFMVAIAFAMLYAPREWTQAFAIIEWTVAHSAVSWWSFKRHRAQG